VPRQLPPPEIHQEESQVVQDVDARDLVVELDAVEHRRPLVEEHDVAQVEVAVTLTDEARLASGLETFTVTFDLTLGRPRHPGEGRHVEGAAAELVEARGVAVDDP